MPVIHDWRPPLTDDRLLAAVSRQWNMTLVKLRPDIPLAGSPERTEWRCVAQTRDGRLYVVEKIASRNYGRKRRIAHILQQLADHGLDTVVTYLPDATGETIPLINHGLYQLSPFIRGVSLDRPAYAHDSWRGKAAANFLIRFYDISARFHAEPPWTPFSFPDYIQNLLTTLSRYQADTARSFIPFGDHLEKNLFPTLTDLPSRLCHGDYHPLNMIWGGETIRAVIDWEFCGVKPEIYDLANLIGCLGMEDPQSLHGPFVGNLVDRMKASGIYTDASWQALPDLMLAIRFAWLSEWVRKNDRPMIRMEADYMSLLLDGLPAF
jgi:homoserine kinase type II